MDAESEASTQNIEPSCKSIERRLAREVSELERAIICANFCGYEGIYGADKTFSEPSWMILELYEPKCPMRVILSNFVMKLLNYV